MFNVGITVTDRATRHFRDYFSPAVAFLTHGAEGMPVATLQAPRRVNMVDTTAGTRPVVKGLLLYSPALVANGMKKFSDRLKSIELPAAHFSSFSLTKFNQILCCKSGVNIT
jgi:hypothetical protein